MNPVAGAVFSGIVLVVLVYSILDLTGIANRIGVLGTALPLPVIGGLMYGVFAGLRALRQHKRHIRIKGPMYLRHLMDSCLKRTCGELEAMLNAPETASTTIFNAILLDKMLWIGATDCLRFIDVRRQIEDSGLRGTAGLALSGFFQTIEAYRERELPEEIRKAENFVARSRMDLGDQLKRLVSAHEALCTGTGDMLAMLPPDPKKVKKIRAGFRFTAPTPQAAQRMAFALETLAFLKAVRYRNVNPINHQRYEAAADQGIPKLGRALKAYRQAWKELVDAYEQPER